MTNPDPTASPSPTPPDQITTYSPMVKCEECGQTCLITNSDIATYARQGWPRHCGLTMTFVPAPPIPNSSSLESVPKISAGVSEEERGKAMPELDDVTDRWFQDFIYRTRLTAKQSQELRERLNKVKVRARDKTVEMMFSKIYAAINEPPNV